MMEVKRKRRKEEEVQIGIQRLSGKRTLEKKQGLTCACWCERACVTSEEMANQTTWQRGGSRNFLSVAFDLLTLPFLSPSRFRPLRKQMVVFPSVCCIAQQAALRGLVAAREGLGIQEALKATEARPE